MQMRSSRGVIHFVAVAAFSVATAPPAFAQAKPPAAPASRTAPAPKAMTNADVIKMVQGGLADDLIAMAIRKAPRTTFDLTADGLLDLKNKGVSNALLRMMLDPTAKFEAAPAAAAPAAPAASRTPPPDSPAPAATARGESAERASRSSEPGTPALVPGGATFSVAKAYGDVWDAVLAYLKKQGQSIASSNRDSGEILTALTVSGGRTQMGRRVQIAVTRDGPTSTSLRVAVAVYPRKKGGGKDAWDDPKVDGRQSRLAADELKGMLTGAQP